MTGHYRLLDAEGVRRTWGSWEQCKQEWDKLDEADELPALKKKVVLVLHGLVRSRDSMSGMAQYLAADEDYSVLNLSYASTRVSLADHAAALQRVVSRLEGVEEISFVAHSMGNLVIRHFLGDQLIAARGLGIDPRIRRIVMLAPPNGGANLAKRFQNNVVFRVIFGAERPAIGKAVGRSGERGWPCRRVSSELLPGAAGDGKDAIHCSTAMTTWSSAWKKPASPVLGILSLCRHVHTLIMDHPKVREYTKRFLDDGYFVSEAERTTDSCCRSRQGGDAR